jgi:carbamoyltransferase
MIKKMKILGLHFGHDANAALIVDGKTVLAVSEDRLNRQKGWRGFPFKSIQWILDEAKLLPSDIDIIVVVNENVPDETLGGNLKTFYERLSKSPPFWAQLTSDPLAILDTIFNLGLRRKIAQKMVQDAILSIGFEASKIKYIDHHLAHAAGAYYMSGYDESLVVTIDGKGDRVSHRTYFAKDNKLTQLHESRDFDSIGFFYTVITGFLGFRKMRHEGKITGLAAYGDLSPTQNIKCPIELIDQDSKFRNTFISDAEANNRWKAYFGFLVHNPSSFFNTVLKTSAIMSQFSQDKMHSYFQKNFKDIKKEHIAAYAQSHLEKLVTKLVQVQAKKQKVSNIALSGGVFANVRLNQKIAELPEINSLFVQPAMADCGLGAGAGLLYFWQESNETNKQVLDHAYLGPEYSDDNILTTLNKYGLNAEQPQDFSLEVGQALANGKIIGLYQGRMEWGPRALGNRSILATAVDSRINDTLNQRLKRTEFMPFAPLVLAEYANDYLMGYDPSNVAANFMTVTFKVNKEIAPSIPAVVHVDGTARPQIVWKTTSPLLHQILSEYNNATGIPVLVNTSFNMHEEPIVCSPDDAVRAFLEGSVDILAIGSYLIKSKQNDAISNQPSLNDEKELLN